MLFRSKKTKKKKSNFFFSFFQVDFVRRGMDARGCSLACLVRFMFLVLVTRDDLGRKFTFCSFMWGFLCIVNFTG